MAEPRYLKNAWAKKDADGVYCLFIQGGDLQARFNLYEPSDAQDEDSSYSARAPSVNSAIGR